MSKHDNMMSFISILQTREETQEKWLAEVKIVDGKGKVRPVFTQLSAFSSCFQSCTRLSCSSAPSFSPSSPLTRPFLLLSLSPYGSVLSSLQPLSWAASHSESFGQTP